MLLGIGCYNGNTKRNSKFLKSDQNICIQCSYGLGNYIGNYIFENCKIYTADNHKTMIMIIYS